jgi:predicted nucleotidyltransferase
MIEINFGITESDKEEILNILKKFPEVEEAIIFGSRALGNHKPGSDVDLVLKGPVDNIRLTIKSILNEETLMPYNFDVLDYSNISNEELKKHIDTYGVSIYRR